MATKTRNEVTSSASAQRPWWRQRWAVLLLGLVGEMVLLCWLSGASWPILVSRLPVDGAFLALWLLAAAGYGCLLPLPRSMGVSPMPLPDKGHGRDAHVTKALHAISCLAFGLGILSILQLLLGLAGLLHAKVAFALIALGVVILGFHCRSIRPIDIRSWMTASVGIEWLWLLALPVLAMTIIAAYVPPGVLWGDEPHGYDVLEYHLQLPREWYELGRIVPLRHNVFSFFPLNVEMHYLLAMQLRRSPWGGMYLAQLMHVTFVALTVTAIYAIARQFTSKVTATLAALAAAHVPWLALLAPVAYNEGGLLLFGTLAIGWVLYSLSLRERAGVRVLAIAGVLAGFACGTKLTAVLQLLFILPLIIAAFRWRSVKQAVPSLIAFFLASVVILSPWLIRNTISTGNPLFPEAQGVLGRAHFNATQTQRWHEAHHLPGPSQRSATARIAAAGSAIFADWRYGYVLLPLGILAALLSIRKPAAWLILGLFAAWLVFWVFFTHLQSRFFVLSIPLAAIAIALLDRRWQIILIALQIGIGLILIARTFDEKVHPHCQIGLLAFDDFLKLLPEETQADLGQADKPIALVGDARAFLYPVAMSRLHYRTVFDVDVKPGQSIIDAWADGAPASAVRIVDPAELDRFARTYYGIPPATITTTPTPR